MKKLFSYFFATMAIATSGAFAQTTNYVDVSNGTYAPLYDCSIYNFSEDRAQCMQLKRDRMATWENQGYAVNCYDGFGRRSREMCLDLADRVQSNTHTIDCGALYQDRYALRQCEIVKNSYESGRFMAPSPIAPPMPRPMPMPQPAPEVSYSNEVRADDQYRALCGPEAYDRNFQIWQTEKARLESRARDRQRTGAALAVGGALVSIFTNSRAGDTIGTVAMIGGATLFTLGMVDASDAKFSQPYSNPVCRPYFVPEYRMVTIEREECRTTQYTERGWGYSRSYYEVQCRTKTYVTYEPNFKPWQSGRPYRY